MTDHTSELFPMMAEGGRDFEVSLRGYDKRQVDAYVARSEAELVALTGERDSATSRSADLAAQLANSHAQIESLRRHLAESSADITADNVDARMRSRVELAFAQSQGIRNQALEAAAETRRLAEADVAESRRQAAEDADRMRDQARQDLRRATEAAQQREADAEAVHADARARAADQLNAARIEADRLLTQVRTENEETTEQAKSIRDRLDESARAARVEAAEDFQIALRIRRTEEQHADAERHAAAVTEADRLVTDATAEAHRLVTDAQNQADRLGTESRAEATRLVTEAQAEADRLVSQAQATADDLVATATIQSHLLVTEAQAHADRISADGQAKVERLTDLRDRVHADLDTVRGQIADTLRLSKELATDHVEHGAPDADKIEDPTSSEAAIDVAPAKAAPAEAASPAADGEPVIAPSDPTPPVTTPGSTRTTRSVRRTNARPGRR